MRRSVLLLAVAFTWFAHWPWAAAENEQAPAGATLSWGALKGTVTYDDDPPGVQDLRELISRSVEKDHFLKAPGKDLLDPTWIVNKKNKGVANVVVWLQPLPGKSLEIPEADKVRKDVVTLDRPFCAYVPHVLTLFPGYQRDGKWHKTGQVFKLVNSAPINHCPKWDADPSVNQSGNIIMPAKSERVLEFKPQKRPIVFT